MDVLFICKRIYSQGVFFDGGILVSAQDGIITKILKGQEKLNSYLYSNESCEVIDFGNKILMPGLIDTHVHINDPGRSDWEGFATATKAAAAGGFTTIVDMPLNSIPPTTSVDNLNIKLRASIGKLYVDVGFWGGVIPGNEKELREMVRNGVVGFKCFLCPSGVEEFPHVNHKQLESALQQLENTDSLLAFHAEVELSDTSSFSKNDIEDTKKYDTFLNTRPPKMEIDAFKLIEKLSSKYNTRMHIVHLSSSEVLPLIKIVKSKGSNITVETCHHYLSIASEEISDEHTEFKCAPPIRSQSNRDKLWQGIKNGEIDLIVSDHSPCTPGKKCLTYGKKRGDFIEAWGGISSVQFGLSLFWTEASKHGLGIDDMLRLMCEEPAKLVGLQNRKGKIEVGYDGDFVIWDPEESFKVSEDIIQFRNKANPYMGKTLKGIVYDTVVRGYHVYQRYKPFGQPMGRILRAGKLSKS